METNRDRCLPDFAPARSDRRRMRCSIGFIALFAGVASLGEVPGGGGEARKPVRRPATSRVESQVERSPADVSFVDVAKDAGLGGAVVVGGGVQNKRYILEVMGGGVAFLDYDSDGWPDIFLVNATTLEGFPQGKKPSNYLFHNNHDKTFTDVTAKASLIR